MINAEVSELKKRFKKDMATFYCVAGCYVNDKKEKVYKFNKPFSTLPELETFKYLEIASKALSGKIKNNLLNVEFPVEEEKPSGTQDLLYQIRESEGEDELLIEKLYDKIIESYQYMHNYLIILFFDQYDVPPGGKKVDDVDEIGEVYHYIIGAICPIELSQPALGYIDQDTGLAITDRNLLVQAPETGFLFPAFNDRSTDIHSLLFYVKNAKLPHEELLTDGFGCERTMTSVQKKGKFNEIFAFQMSDLPDKEAHNSLIDTEYKLQQMINAHKAEHGEMAVLKATEDVLYDLVDDLPIDDETKEGLVTALTETFDEETDASLFVSFSNMPIGEVRAEKKVIANVLSQKEKELANCRSKCVSGNYNVQDIDGVKYMLIPTENNVTVIDGVEYVLVPVDD